MHAEGTLTAHRLTPTAEQTEFQRVVRSFLQARSPSAAVRRLMDSDIGYDADVWRDMAAQLSLQSLLVPDADESGASWLTLALVMEEMGRALLASPFLPSAVLATSALLALRGTEAADELLPLLTNGSCVGTVAHLEVSVRPGVQSAVTTADQSGDRWTLTGAKDCVLAGAQADVLLVTARTSTGGGLFLVEAGAPRLDCVPLSTLDVGRRQARVFFHGTPCRIVGSNGAVDGVLARVLDSAALAVAAEQLGIAARCLEVSVDYAGVRHQFGRPIGSFQAIKHRCADMLVDVESARSALYQGTRLAAGGDAGLRVGASLAKAFCSEASCRVAAAAIQVHGGIGYTWEHDLHLYYRRAFADALLFGDAVHHRERIASAVGM
jgi:alkylation response protein AidB-like acyl-CoA dehydrogenase